MFPNAVLIQPRLHITRGGCVGSLQVPEKDLRQAPALPTISTAAWVVGMRGLSDPELANRGPLLPHHHEDDVCECGVPYMLSPRDQFRKRIRQLENCTNDEQ